MKKIFLTLIVIIAAMLPATAQVTPESAFTTAPSKVLPSLEQSARLDLLDYHREGIDRLIPNVFGDSAHIVSSTPATLRFAPAEGMTVDFVVLPAKGKEIIMVITTVDTPMPDSSIDFYTHDWQQLDASKLLKLPAPGDWCSAKSKAELAEWQRLVPFLTVSADYDPASMTLTLVPTPGDYIDSEQLDRAKQLTVASISYKWTGSKFQLVK